MDNFFHNFFILYEEFDTESKRYVFIKGCFYRYNEMDGYGGKFWDFFECDPVIFANILDGIDYFIRESKLYDHVVYENEDDPNNHAICGIEKEDSPELYSINISKEYQYIFMNKTIEIYNEIRMEL